MAFSSGNSGGPMADINVTPLVDVMLVLLIIFIITAPLMSHKVKVELPKANLNQDPDKDDKRPNPITVSVKEDGSLYWNDVTDHQGSLGIALLHCSPADSAAAAQPAWRPHHQDAHDQRDHQDRAGSGHAGCRFHRDQRQGELSHGIQLGK